MNHRRSTLSATLAGLVLAGAIAAAEPAQAGTRLLVGMGDSYSTGAGIPPEDQSPDDCQRSEGAYPLIAADELGFAGHSVACGGAVLADITGNSRRGSAPQIDGIAGADLIAVTIGGNDIGGPGGVLDSSRTAVSMSEFATSVQLLGPQLLATYTDLRRAAPRAQIYILGYPDIVPTTQSALHNCLGPQAAQGLRAKDIHRNVDLLNATIADAAAEAGAAFVETSTSFAGHEMCTPDAYANAPSDPAPASAGAVMHPNELGHLVMAADLLAAIGAPDPRATPSGPGTDPPPAAPTAQPSGLSQQERAAARAIVEELLGRLRGALCRHTQAGR